MDRATGAVFIAIALFGVWALNTGRLPAIGNIIANGPQSATGPGVLPPSGLVAGNAKPACHSFLSASCAGAIGTGIASIESGNVIGGVGAIFKGLFG